MCNFNTSQSSGIIATEQEFTYNNTASVTGMLSDLKWDTLETRRKKNRLTLMYKLSHNLMDTEEEPQKNT